MVGHCRPSSSSFQCSSSCSQLYPRQTTRKCVRLTWGDTCIILMMQPVSLMVHADENWTKRLRWFGEWVQGWVAHPHYNEIVPLFEQWTWWKLTELGHIMAMLSFSKQYATTTLSMNSKPSMNLSNRYFGFITSTSSLAEVLGMILSFADPSSITRFQPLDFEYRPWTIQFQSKEAETTYWNLKNMVCAQQEMSLFFSFYWMVEGDLIV